MYKKVHYILPCCAGARLLRWPLARLIPLLALLPLLATHHRRCPARRGARSGANHQRCFNFQWPGAPAASASLAAVARATPAGGAPSAKGSSKLLTPGHRRCQPHRRPCLLTCKRVSWLA